MNISQITLIIITLAVFRLSCLLSIEDGPYLILDRFRKLIGVTEDNQGYLTGTNELAKMIICQKCNSIWIAIFVLLFYWLSPTITFIVCLPFAISSAVIIMEKFYDG